MSYSAAGFGLKRKVLLCDIAKRHHNDSRQYLGYRGVDAEMLHEYFDKGVVQQYADQHQQEVPEQLYPALKHGSWKDDVLVQQVAGGEAHCEGDHECGDIGTDSAE